MAKRKNVAELLENKGDGLTSAELADAGPDREQRIRELAYAKSQSRDFAPGHEHEDWLAAEREIDGRADSHG